jgi:hypothetical protein
MTQSDLYNNEPAPKHGLILEDIGFDPEGRRLYMAALFAVKDVDGFTERDWRYIHVECGNTENEALQKLTRSYRNIFEQERRLDPSNHFLEKRILPFESLTAHPVHMGFTENPQDRS